ncbi:hypothetical protein A2160_06180 [Candidatus Beckwithbacteria bacterium RBG_13_42_9]|uniref:Trigger factor n=1 Tax=Candidatus Beckwithbacteria bacterium RBG_13_42_9 TaxID=1797457 RepID=A0A1F5E5E2_9BACT|nr:MAG: hypothetical protein A2160_06180 [Candidatus Beckwithbacteria bacterium RBG_13_42_9]
MPAKPKSTKPIAPKSDSKPKLTWLPNKTFELTLTIPKEEVKKTYGQVLSLLAKDTAVKGFRQGKAPEKLVEEKVGKSHVYEHVVQELVTGKYLEALKKHQLKPIISPKVSMVSMKDGEDWAFKATACEMPEIKLGKWEEAVKGVNATAKIWTPASGKPATPESKAGDQVQTQPESEDKKIAKIFDALLKEAQVDLSQILIDDETNRMLSKLLDQVNKLGMTIDQYLASEHKTSDQLRQEYRELAERTLKLEFILAEIGQEKNFAVTEKEVELMIQAVPDEKSRQNLQTPEQKTYIASILRKRKTIDFLLKL